MNQKEIKNTNQSYRQILKSSTIIGGSSVISVFLGIIRVKFLAVLLGPAGVGLIGIYSSITGIMGTFAGMGVSSSGVRQIAEASSRGDQGEIVSTIITLRRVSLFLGMLGMLILILFSAPICQLTFGNKEYATELAFLSVIIFFGAVSDGQSALIQGMRRIADLAKIGVLGSLFGTLCGIPIIYFFGLKGIVPFLIGVSAMSILTSWWFARKMKVSSVPIGWREIWGKARGLLNLGLAMMTSGLMTGGTMYLLRVLVVRQLGIDAAGLYQAAVTLSSIYAGFILEAMGRDFYPRLSSIAEDNARCNQLVNEQAEVGFLLAVPGILATLTFAPLIISLFYSEKFALAFEVLRWQVLGILARVASWPMGFILLAKGKGTIFFWTELVANAVHIGLIWVGISYFGLTGTGIAFFIMYVFYWFLIYAVVNHLTGLTWSAKNVRIAFRILPAVGIVFLARFFMPNFWYMILGSTITVAMGFYSIKCLVEIISPAGFIYFMMKIRNRFCGENV